MRELVNWPSSFLPGLMRRRGSGRSLLFSLQDEINNLFDNFFDNRTAPRAGNVVFPAIDVDKKGDEFGVRGDVPDMDAEDIWVSVSEGLLAIKG